MKWRTAISSSASFHFLRPVASEHEGEVSQVVTFHLRARKVANRYTVQMDRDTYIAPIVDICMPDASHAEKLELTRELWELFDALFAVQAERERFDSITPRMVESDSREMFTSAPIP